ncbi:hypothetical protein AAG570_005221 [Ranatra chinensis]|uniref:Aminopeptidase N n=1 Tax=Ranatra chinensis TaxID=642074 RepID=A0ABD0YI35_9HEMI
MMNLFLGEATFRKGVSNYLKEHGFNNAEQDDLWSSLTEQGHKDNTLDQEVTIKEIMDTWTLQTGYPLVTVIRDYENGTARVTQGRYLQIQPDKKEAQNESCWWVPLSYTSQAEPRFNITRPNTWLNCADNRSITIQGLPSRDHWVIFNINGAGVYRVQSIGAMNRAHLTMNALDSAWRGDMEYPVAMAIVSYLKREKEFLPWKAGLSCLNNIDRMLRRTPVYGGFKRFVGDPVAPAFGQFGKITDVPKKFEDVKHHVAITNWACKYNIGGCRQQAQKVIYYIF